MHLVTVIERETNMACRNLIWFVVAILMSPAGLQANEVKPKTSGDIKIDSLTNKPGKPAPQARKLTPKDVGFSVGDSSCSGN